MNTANEALTIVKKLPPSLSVVRAKESIDESAAKLGISSKELTPKVASVLANLLKKVDGLTQELARAKDDFIELEKMVDVDSVAPVPNRRAFMRRLSWALAMNERYGHPCSILYFDINDFKEINDTYGHAAGDVAIRHVANIFLESLRGSDFMARLSGDEFAVLMYYAPLNSAERRGHKIAAQIGGTPFNWNNQKISVSTAYGAYEVQKGDTAETALAHADKAMYLDKRKSKELAK